MWYSTKFVKFCIFFIFPILKISSVQRKWFKFEFWRPCLRGIPSFWYSQIFSNFILFSYLPILKISCALHERLKSLNLAAPFEGDTSISVPPKFVKLYLFFIFENPENFMCLAYVVKKFEFKWPRLRGTLHFDDPKLFQNLLERPTLASRIFLFLLGYFQTSECEISDFC